MGKLEIEESNITLKGEKESDKKEEGENKEKDKRETGTPEEERAKEVLVHKFNRETGQSVIPPSAKGAIIAGGVVKRSVNNMQKDGIRLLEVNNDNAYVGVDDRSVVEE